jgi:hypothetical protein
MIVNSVQLCSFTKAIQWQWVKCQSNRGLSFQNIVAGNINWALASGTLTGDIADAEWEGFQQLAGSNTADSLGFHQADLHCDRYTQDTYVCLCPLGWTGENCDVDVDECSSNPCHNGGRLTSPLHYHALFTSI